MLNLSFVSNDDSTSICDADAPLDIPPMADRYTAYGGSIYPLRGFDMFCLRQNDILGDASGRKATSCCA